MIVKPGFFEVNAAKIKQFNELQFSVEVTNDEKQNIQITVVSGWLHPDHSVSLSEYTFVTGDNDKIILKPGNDRIKLHFNSKEYDKAVTASGQQGLMPVVILQTRVADITEGTSIGSSFSLPIYIYQTITDTKDNAIQPKLLLNCSGANWVVWPGQVTCHYTVVNNPQTPLRLRNQITVAQSRFGKNSVRTQLIDKHRVFLPDEEIQGEVQVSLRPFAQSRIQLSTIVSDDQTSWRVSSAPIDRLYLPWYTGSLLLGLLLVIGGFIAWKLKRKAKKHGASHQT